MELQDKDPRLLFRSAWGPGASRIVEPEVYVIPRALLKVKILSYKYKCKYKREVLFTVRKEIITNSKFKKNLMNITSITKSRGKIRSTIFLLTSCITNFYNIFPKYFDCIIFDHLFMTMILFDHFS